MFLDELCLTQKNRPILYPTSLWCAFQESGIAQGSWYVLFNNAHYDELNTPSDLYAHVIPCKSFEGLKTRHEGVPIDIVVIRENTQGGRYWPTS